MHAGHFSFRTARPTCHESLLLEIFDFGNASSRNVLGCCLCHAHLLLLQQLQDNIPTHHLGSNNKERSQADSLTYPRQTRLLSVTCLTGSAFLRQQRLLPVDGRGRTNS
jgi:hypothetical protein